MGLNYHRGPPPDRKQAIRLVREAAERGVTLFDAAEGYGPYTNEALLGEALRGVRAEVFVAANDNRRELPRFTPAAMRANLRIVEALYAFGRTRGMTAAQSALAWRGGRRAPRRRRVLQRRAGGQGAAVSPGLRRGGRGRRGGGG